MYWPKGVGVVSAQLSQMFPGSKRGKATVSPTLGFDDRKRDKQKCALHLPIQIRHQQPKSQTEDMSCLFIVCISKPSENPQSAETGVSQETEASQFDLLPQA